ncbi:MAG: VCBS repeat-containing protein [Bacteroidia bacterium]|nr:VCBS repeat-containing protein [Bacteroidia bacterium]
MKTIKIIYKTAFVIILLLITELSFSQIIQQGEVINVTGEVSNTVGRTYIARDKVTMKDGFRFRRTSNEEFNAKLNENMLIDVDYQPDIDPGDPGSRPWSSALPVGTTAGSFNVSLSGAATYSIPILVPPGTADIVPNIAVTYNSMAGDGIMGLGWNISGISAITRVSKTIYHDGATGTVNLDTDDRLALDGNRLINTSGNYGTDATEYHTEIETFTKVTAHGDFNSSSCWFEAETKDGRTIEYGYANNSRVILDGANKAVSWLVNKVTDKTGNYVKFSYRDMGSSEFVIDKIEYTGNAGLSPYNSVNFYYETKPVYNTIYIAGYPIKQTALLNKIKTICEGNPVKEYKFSYADHLYSQLIEITEYGSDGSHYNSTVFGYNSGSQQPSDVDVTGLTCELEGTGAEYLALDYNGDGKQDLLQMVWDILVGKQWRWWNLYRNDGENNFTQVVSQGAFPADFQPPDNFFPVNKGSIGNMIIANSDFNGDNNDDMMFTTVKEESYYTYTFYPYLSNGSTFQPQTSFERASPSNDDHGLTLRYLDIDGDGRLDIFTHNVDYSDLSGYVRLNINGDYTTPWPTGIGSEYEFKNSYPIDLDGDGKTELANIYNTDNGKYYIMKFINNLGLYIGTTTEHPSALPGISPFDKILPGDFNGDGKTDILKTNSVLQTSPDFKWTVALNKGDNNTFDEKDYTIFESPFLTMADNDKRAWHYVADVNGDGKSDIVEIVNQPGTDYYHTVFSTINVFISTGKSFIALTPYVLNWKIDEDLYEIDLGDFDGDGALEIFINKGGCGAGNIHIIDFNLSPSDYLLKIIKDGFDYETDINYKSITDNSVYTKGTGATFPNSDFQKPLNVVSSVVSNNGFDLTHDTKYTYTGAKLHKQGKGFLGFSEILTENSNTNIKTKQTFEMNNNNTYYIFQPKTTEIKNGSTPVSLTTNTNEIYPFGNNRIFPYTSQSVTNDVIKGVTFTTIYDYGTTGSDYMLYGNVYKVTTSFGSDGSNKVEYSYTNAGAWCPGKPATVKETSDRTTPASSFVKTTTFSYTNGAVSGISVDPGTTTSLTLNSFGLPDVITISGTGAATRTIYLEYDSKKRFVTSEKNSLNHKTETQYDPRFGVPVFRKDISNLVTTYTYDGFGRLKKTTTPQGNVATNTFAFESGNGMNNTALYSITTTMSGAPYLKKYYDIFSRVVKEETQGYDGSANKVVYTYTEKGQLYTKSLPYEATSAGDITYTYSDPIGRVTNVSHPSGANISYVYTPGLVVITNFSMGEVTTKTIDAFGLTTQSSGNPSGLIKYEYNSRGLLTKAESPGSAVTMDYDDFGYQDYLNDPDAGYIDYSYSAFGELLTQTDAKGTFTMVYDEIGRLLSKVHSTGVASNYTYYSDGFGIGKIKKIEGSDNVKYEYKYDRYGNTVELTENIQGKIFVSKYNYDNFGRVVKTTYPTESNSFIVLNEYDPSTGYLKKIKKSDNTVIWEGNTCNQYLQPTKYYTIAGNLETKKNYDIYGNISGINTASGAVQNLSYNITATTGLMNGRNDILQSINETFDYNDNMKRLKKSHINSVLSQNVDYDALGNITFKSDVGDLKYEGIPYAVTAVKNGSYMPMNSQEINYTVFQKVDYIKEYTDETATDYHYAKFTYGPDDQRRIMKQYYNTDLQRSKYYATNFEREEYTDGARELHYISAGDGLCAIYVKNSRNGVATDTLYYIYKDHLGSITTITDESGNVVQQLRYDPWGKRSILSGITHPIFDHGFTGHEHLDAFALINMNDRVYDPILGRFLSPDNFTQLPDYSQSYNKFSYCLNNPLKYTDPSGNNFWAIFGIAALADVVAWPIATGVVDALTTAFFKGGLDFSSSSSMGQAWSSYDPSASWSMTNKSYKISVGMFQTDPNRNFAGRAWQLTSRFTWEGLQTFVGYNAAQTHNILGGVKSVDYYGGATLLEGYSVNWGAVTLGNYIFGSRGIKADPSDPYFQHEYGHYLQSQEVGPLFYFAYGLPSLFHTGSSNYDHYYTEQNANLRAYRYFNRHYDNFNGWSPWNPIDDYNADATFWGWDDWTDQFEQWIKNSLTIHRP